MSRRALFLMVLILVAATTAAAATAFAGERNEMRRIGKPVADAVHVAADAQLKVKVLSMVKPARSTNGLVIPKPPKR